MKFKEQYYDLGYTRMELISEVIDSEILDTTVKIGSEVICSIAGQDIKEFVKKMQSLINEYRI